MVMKVKTKKIDEGLEFEFNDTHNTIVNTIRRCILDDVPTMAIEDVEIFKNESPLYNEDIAHRIGLIPLKTDLKNYTFREGDLGDVSNEVKFDLDVSKENEYVYSDELKSSDPAVFPTVSKIPITKLFGGKSLKLSAKAILGTGKEHSKWSPAHTYLYEDEKNKSIKLIVEGFGQLSEKEIYNKSIDILNEKIDKIVEVLK